MTLTRVRSPPLTSFDAEPGQFSRYEVQRVGVTYSTVNHWENGKRVPLPFLVKRLIETKEELDAQNTKPPRKRTPR